MNLLVQKRHLPGQARGRRRVSFTALALILLLNLISFAACAVDEKDYSDAGLFVDGLPVHPFALFTLLDPYPALKSGFVKMRPADFNAFLDRSLVKNRGAVVGSMRALQTLALDGNSPLRGTLGRGANLINRLRTRDTAAYGTSLGLMERIRRSPQNFVPALIPIRNAGLSETYVTKSQGEIQNTFTTLADLLEDAEIIQILRDTEDVLLKTSVPSSNLRTGLLSIASGLLDPTLTGDQILTTNLLGFIGGVGNGLRAKAGFSDSKASDRVVKELIINLENFFTVGAGGGDVNVYDSVTDYTTTGHTTAALRNDSSLLNHAKDLFTTVKNFISPSAATVVDNTQSLISGLGQNMYALRDFTKEASNVDESIRLMVQQDLLGQSRESNTASEPISALESLIFVLNAAHLYGYNWNGNPSSPQITGMTNGVLTVSDAMHALGSKLDGTSLGVFQVLTNQVAGQVNRDGTNGGGTLPLRATANDPALLALQGESRGPLTSAGDTVNRKTIPWVMGWIKRVLFEGYGPYYNVNKTDSSGNFLAPDGSVYDPSAAGKYKASWSTSAYRIQLRNADGGGVECAGLQGDEIENCTGNGSSYTIPEIIGQNENSRKVFSDETAFYKNFQWLLNEKRFVLVLPVQAIVSGGALAGLKEGAYVTIVANGLKGLMGAKPYCATSTALCNKSDNGKWLKTGNTIKITDSNGRTSQGDLSTFSSTPGDSVVLVEVWGFGLSGSTYGFTDTSTWDALYNPVLFTKTANQFFGAIPPALSVNFPVFERMSFLTSDEVPSASTETYWNRRNKLLPLVGALAKTLHDQSDGATNKNAFDLLTNMAQILVRPHITTGTEPVSGVGGITYLKVRGSGGSTGMRSPSMTLAEYYPDCLGDPFGKCNGAAANNLRSLISILTENQLRFQDGILNLIGKSSMMTFGTRMLTELGSPARKAGRDKLIAGIEQYMQQVHLTADITNATTQFDIESLFTRIDTHLRGYPDTRSTDPESTDWKRVADVHNLFSDLLSSGPYGIMNNIDTIIDVLVFAGPTDGEVSAFLDLLRVGLTNSSGAPNYELTEILSTDVVKMVRLSLPNARSLTGSLEGLTAPGLFMDYAYATVRSDFSIDLILRDFERFLQSPAIQNFEDPGNNILISGGLLIKYFADVAERGKKIDPGNYIFEDRWNTTEESSSLFDRLNYVLSLK